MKVFRITIFLFLVFWNVRVVHGSSNSPLTKEDKAIWSTCIKRVQMKPPCCGACQLMTSTDAKAIWKYLTVGPDGKSEKIWMEYKNKLLAEFKNLNPKRYEELYP